MGTNKLQYLGATLLVEETLPEEIIQETGVNQGDKLLSYFLDFLLLIRTTS